MNEKDARKKSGVVLRGDVAALSRSLSYGRVGSNPKFQVGLHLRQQQMAARRERIDSRGQAEVVHQGTASVEAMSCVSGAEVLPALGLIGMGASIAAMLDDAAPAPSTGEAETLALDPDAQLDPSQSMMPR